MNEEIILGVSGLYHDSAACLFLRGDIVAAIEEERFTGIKHDSSFPINSISWILKRFNLTINDVTTLVWYEDPFLKTDRKKHYLQENKFRSFKHFKDFILRKNIINIEQIIRRTLNYRGKIKYVDHHLSHSAFSFFTSPFEESAIVTVDGVGEWETLTISKGEGTEIYKLYSINYPNSLGLFYSTMTSYLGFKPNEGEYKLMGLAPYGNPNQYYNKLEQLVDFHKKDIFEFKQEYFSWTYDDKLMFTKNLIGLLEIDPRQVDEPILQHHMDLAASVQKLYEDIFKQVLIYAKQLTGSKNLVIGGGCAYNGVANNKAYKFFNNIFVPFAPSDSGSAIGAVLYYAKQRSNLSPFLGNSFTDNEIQSSLKKYQNKIYIELLAYQPLLERVASYIHKGKVIGWFQGKMEFGARALGNRSIIASPLFPDMKRRINSVIKKRESFRPFAPSCILEDAINYFYLTEPIPYMNQVVQVKGDSKTPKFPSITHIDNSARVQTVSRSNNSKYYDLLQEVKKVSGYPIVLNTSFNFKDQTITLDPKTAIERFLDSDMDFLVINNYLISKKK